MLGAFVTLALVTIGVNFFVAFIIGAVFCAILGVTIERFAYRPLRQVQRIAAILSAIAVSFILQNLVILFWGAQNRVFPDIIPNQIIRVKGITFSSLQIEILAISIFSVFIIEIALRRTKIGLAIRAVNQDIPISSLMGVNVNKMIALTFALGSILAALGGVLVRYYLGVVYPRMGYLGTMKAFTAAILGGMGSVLGALLGR